MLIPRPWRIALWENLTMGPSGAGWDALSLDALIDGSKPGFWLWFCCGCNFFNINRIKLAGYTSRKCWCVGRREVSLKVFVSRLVKKQFFLSRMNGFVFGLFYILMNPFTQRSTVGSTKWSHYLQIMSPCAGGLGFVIVCWCIRYHKLPIQWQLRLFCWSVLPGQTKWGRA